MKSLDELTREELANLTDAEINSYTIVKCVVEGIPTIVQDPGPKPEQPLQVEGEKCVVYVLGNFIFQDQEEAESVLKLIKSCVLLKTDYKTDYWYRYVKPIDRTYVYDIPSVVEESYYIDEQTSLVAQDRMKGVKEKIKQWEEDFEEFSKATARIQDIRFEILDMRTTAQKELDKISYYQAEYQTCLEVANNDSEIAKKFFEKMFPELPPWVTVG